MRTRLSLILMEMTQLFLRKQVKLLIPLDRWDHQLTFGKDVTLVRKSSIITGDPIIDDVFDSNCEWEVITVLTIHRI